ncbi:hypothetical protein NLI96_g6944 [Meripilus lineatus]|uniref:Mini-chromosome maintenance complex-binding protein n=1 Tax=Meripilus lineatus TaxID=2056292 RepID=A0AAD5V0B9_9APHY|nr:hypothetical protein NLI96_g6944 [Physisporinus lineatus]
MVSAYLVDALRDPTVELQDLFTSASSSATEFPQLVANHFSRVFRTETAYKQIPALNLQNPPEAYAPRSLVRFRGMVQDTSPSTEMYLFKSPDGKVGGWGIEREIDADSHPELNYENLRESTVLWATSVPGESSWYSDHLEGPNTESPSAHDHVPSRPHKFHNPQLKHVGVQVKLYGDNGTHLKSTDIATFVGILAFDHLSIDHDDPPMVPTLHVLYVRDETEPPSLHPLEHGTRQSLREITETRSNLLQWLSHEALGGDKEAAEWALLSIIASVQARTPPLLPPSITISQFPLPSSNESGTSPTLSHILSLILPRLITLPLSLNFLNNSSFAPESKDEDLHAGMLQLPKGTALLVTENGLRVSNLQVLQEILSSQTLAYDFPFSRFSFPTDLNCLILAEGKKSAFFRTDFVVPLRPQNGNDNESLWRSGESIEKPNDEVLATFRHMIHAARSGKIQVNDATSEYIQEDFVRERQRNKSVTSDDLIRWMTIAKRVACLVLPTGGSRD